MKNFEDRYNDLMLRLALLSSETDGRLRKRQKLHTLIEALLDKKLQSIRDPVDKIDFAIEYDVNVSIYNIKEFSAVMPYDILVYPITSMALKPSRDGTLTAIEPEDNLFRVVKE